MRRDDERVETAPEGSTCAQHPEKPALVTCPRCGSHCCIVCWQGALQRCHACVMRERSAPVPWADDEKGLAARFFGTLAGVASPTRSATGFLSGDHRRGWSFLLSTALPLAALSGIVPFTHHLVFGPSWSIEVVGDPSAADLALDIAQACGLGLLLGAVKLAVVSAPFVSLSGAYGVKMESEPARQVMLYRGWLLVISGQTGLLMWLAISSLPGAPTSTASTVIQVLTLAPLMVLLWSMTSAARLMRVGPIASMAVVLIPFVLLVLVEPLVLSLVAPYLPDPEAVREAAAAAGQAGLR